MRQVGWLAVVAFGVATVMGSAVGCGSSDDGTTTGSPGGGGAAGGAGSATDAGSDVASSDAQAGSSGDGGIDAAPDSAPDAPAALSCQDVTEGMNQNFMVDGQPRSFIVNLPTGVTSGGPWPVVFNWHGLGDTAQNMAAMLKGQVNDAAFPFILVTPEKGAGVDLGNVHWDWQVFQVDAAINPEARLFDEVLSCLASRFNVDSNHVHSVGFSLGAIATDMLGTIRGETLASIFSYSGGYFSDSQNTATLGLAASMISWPAPTHTNPYAQVIAYGGANDQFGNATFKVHFDTFATNDTPYLNGLHHDVVLCNHGQGHSAPVPGLQPAQVVEFLKDHPKGTTSSPWTAALPSDYPAFCAFQPHQ